jgi:hypothetical protein
VVIHAKTDVVLAGVMRRLALPVPDYVRVDRLVVSHVVGLYKLNPVDT